MQAFERATSRWRTLYGIESGGAVLVRPDGFVVARWRTAPANATADLEQALAGLARRGSK